MLGRHYRTLITALSLITLALPGFAAAGQDVSLLDSTVPMNWLVKSVCVDSSNRPLQVDPYGGCPSGSTIRKIDLGDPLPYYNYDGFAATWDNYPVRAPSGQVYELNAREFTQIYSDHQFRYTGQSDQADIYTVNANNDGWVSAVGTRDGGGYDQTFFGPNCEFGGGWVFFPTTNFLSGGVRTNTMINNYWMQSGESFPGTCDSATENANPNNNATYWQYVSAYPFQSNGASQKPMDTIIAHFGPSQGSYWDMNTQHIEVFYFTREYGLTRWEVWTPQQQNPVVDTWSCGNIPSTVTLQGDTTGTTFVITDCHDISSTKLATAPLIPVWPIPQLNILSHANFDSVDSADYSTEQWHRVGNSIDGGIINWSLYNSKTGGDNAYGNGAGVRYLATNCNGTCAGPWAQEIYQEIPISKFTSNATYAYGLSARVESASESGTIQVTLQQLDSNNNVLWTDDFQKTLDANTSDSVYHSSQFIYKTVQIPINANATLMRFYFTPIAGQTFDIMSAYLAPWPAVGSFGAMNLSPTATLSISPTSINAGGSATLSWNSTNASSCTVNYTPTDGSTPGSFSVTPNMANSSSVIVIGTYSMTCTGTGATSVTSNSVTLSKNSAAATVSLDANGNNPATIGWGDTYALNWSSTNATACTLSLINPDGTAGGTVSVTPNSAGSGTYTALGTYTLTCTGTDLNDVSKSLLIRALPAAPASISASCKADGTSATISWPAASGATSYDPRVWSPKDSCPSGWTLFTDNNTCYIDGYTGGLSITFPTTPGTLYGEWVHSSNAAGTNWTNYPYNTFSCAAPINPALSAAPASVSPSGSVTVSWSDVHTGGGTWIGLFKKGDPLTDASLQTAGYVWAYLNCTKTLSNSPVSGSCSFTIPSSLSAGTYIFELFGDSTYNDPVVQSNDISVSGISPNIAITIDQQNPSTSIGKGITLSGTATNLANVRVEIGAGNYSDANAIYDSVSTPVGNGKWSVWVPNATFTTAGTYKIIVGGVKGSGISTQASTPLTVLNGDAIKFGASPSFIHAGDPTWVSWSGLGSSNTRAWIALFKKGDPFTQGSLKGTEWTWVYANSDCSRESTNPSTPSGSCRIPTPSDLPPGVYVYELFGDGTYNNPIATSEEIGAGVPTITVDQSDQNPVVPPGAAFSIHGTSANMANIRLEIGSTKNFTDADAIFDSVSTPVTTSNGNWVVNVPAGKLNTPGYYYVYVGGIVGSGLASLAQSAVTISGANITLDQQNPATNVGSGLALSGTSNLSSVRIEIGIGNFSDANAIYDSGTVSVTSIPNSNGSWNVWVPVSTFTSAGTYTIDVGGAQGSGIGAVTSAPLTVTTAPTLSTNSSRVATGGSVTLSWNDFHTDVDTWIGLFKKGDAFTYNNLAATGFTWAYLNCAKSIGSSPISGSCSFTIPSNLPSGTYIFELFGDSTYNDPVLQSNDVQVSTIGPTQALAPNTSQYASAIAALGALIAQLQTRLAHGG